MSQPYLLLDLASAPIDGADQYLVPARAPRNYKDPAKIADYIAEAEAEQREKMALDIDLARITAIGVQTESMREPQVWTVPTEAEEAGYLKALSVLLRVSSDAGRVYDQPRTIITFSGFRFDLPLLMRRALYLQVPMPEISLDRYRSPHVDVWNKLSFNDPRSLAAHSLTWYVRRFGWTDLVKPLSGAEEATAARDGKWDELAASVTHDVVALGRLAAKMGVI